VCMACVCVCVCLRASVMHGHCATVSTVHHARAARQYASSHAHSAPCAPRHARTTTPPQTRTHPTGARRVPGHNPGSAVLCGAGAGGPPACSGAGSRAPRRRRAGGRRGAAVCAG
jgi:hypothetical protein